MAAPTAERGPPCRLARCRSVPCTACTAGGESVDKSAHHESALGRPRPAASPTHPQDSSSYDWYAPHCALTLPARVWVTSVRPCWSAWTWLQGSGAGLFCTASCLRVLALDSRFRMACSHKWMRMFLAPNFLLSSLSHPKDGMHCLSFELLFCIFGFLYLSLRSGVVFSVLASPTILTS